MQTSWLFTNPREVEFGTTEDKFIHWKDRGLEPGTEYFTQIGIISAELSLKW